MTETEWWAATDSLRLIDWVFFDTSAIERKVRLFAGACCRRVEQRITIREFATALECVDLFADGYIFDARAAEVCYDAVSAYQAQWGGILNSTNEADASRAVISALSAATDIRSPFHRSREWYEQEDNFPYPYWSAVDAAESGADENSVASEAEMRERFAQVHLLHDIFGPLPFREVAIAPEWLTSDVTALARGIYDDKAFDRMPILADALQDAGCDNDEMLNHCRDEMLNHCRDEKYAHVRGCWVLDLLLGKPWREGA